MDSATSIKVPSPTGESEKPRLATPLASSANNAAGTANGSEQPKPRVKPRFTFKEVVEKNFMPSRMAAIAAAEGKPVPVNPGAVAMRATMASVGANGGPVSTTLVPQSKQNWDLIISALKSKANDGADPFSNPFHTRVNYLHATDKENWIFFSIIISVVIALSILFCFLVYKFFPKYE
jgi:hypothetical protein